MMFKRDDPTGTGLVKTEAIGLITACLRSFIVNLESHSSDLKAILKRGERFPSIMLIEEMKYLV